MCIILEVHFFLSCTAEGSLQLVHGLHPGNRPALKSGYPYVPVTLQAEPSRCESCLPIAPEASHQGRVVISAVMSHETAAAVRLGGASGLFSLLLKGTSKHLWQALSGQVSCAHLPHVWHKSANGIWYKLST